MNSSVPLTTSTAILCRLFARFEGSGELMISVPGGMRDLAERLVEPEPGEEVITARRFKSESRLVFRVREDARVWVKGLEGLSLWAMARDRCALGEVLSRVALSGLKTNPIRRSEMAHLQRAVGDGAWCSGIALLEEDDQSALETS